MSRIPYFCKQSYRAGCQRIEKSMRYELGTKLELAASFGASDRMLLGIVNQMLNRKQTEETKMLFNVLVLVQPEAGQLPLEQGIVVEASNTEHARTEALRTAGFFNLNPLRVVGVMYSKEQKQ